MIKIVPISELVTRAPFDSLFSIDPDVLDAIQDSMQHQGFDASNPILVWKGEGVVVDGHTRLQAAEDIGIPEVPVFEQEFADEAQAVEYAIRHQRDRRNRELTNAEIFRCVEAIHSPKSIVGRPRKGGETFSRENVSPGRANDETASLIGVKPMTVARVLAILKDGDDALKAEVLIGKTSIKKAYEEIRKQKRLIAEAQGRTGKSRKTSAFADSSNGHPETPETTSLTSVVDRPPEENPEEQTESGTSISESEEESESLVLIGTPEPKHYRPAKFNRTNDMVEWALWTWNPVTGCEHNCVYCYARDIANEIYKEKFEPTFRPERLNAPRHMKVPEAARDNIGEKNVFVCSMADLFGRWVPDDWIESVMAEVRNAPQWNFLFLTKFPLRYEGIDFPDNAWVGTSVDEQRRVASAEKAFLNVKAKVKWLSCEPLRERLTFKSLEMFDWVVIGGQSVSSQAPAFQPPWEWVEHLHTQARAAGCQVYWKPNLETRPREYPGQLPELQDLPLDRSESDHERAIAP
jgi:protein gp37